MVSRQRQRAAPVRVGVIAHGRVRLGEVVRVLTDGRIVVRLDLPIAQPDGSWVLAVAEHAARIEYESALLTQAPEWHP